MKKKKKGFTLIELLAIIVILAIIAVITVPIILNIIENSKRGAVIDSAYGYKDSINKYYVTELAKDSDFALSDGVYTVQSDGSIKNGDSNIYIIPFTGTKPSGGSITLENNEITDACIIIDEYAVTYAEGKFTTNGKGNCNGSLVGGSGGELGDDPSVISCPDTVEFNDDDEDNSWECIIQAVQNNKTSGMQVGNTKTVNLGDELGEHTLRIANTSTDPKCSQSDFSETACGFVLEFADIITEHNMNTEKTNKGGWRDSEMRKYLNCTNGGAGTYKAAVESSSDLTCDGFSEPTIYDSLPEALRNAIIDTRVVSGHENDVSENYTTTDKIYLLATAEVWENGVSSDTAIDKTRQLDYYAQDPKTTTNNSSKAIKNYNGIATCWWLRSAYSSLSSRFFSGAGVDYYFANNGTVGVAPAFRIGSQ